MAIGKERSGSPVLFSFLTPGGGEPLPLGENKYRGFMDFKTKEGIDEILKLGCATNQLTTNDDGPLRMILNEDINVPWYMVRDSSRDDCAYWGCFVTLPGLGKGKSFIPFECLNCWKVVTRPRNYSECMKMKNIIDRMGPSAKCGMELRNSVHGNWGSYHYCRTIEEGLDKYHQVRKEVDENISPDMKVILKRGCTEYELGHGDSATWQPFEGQEEIEAYISEKVVAESIMDNQTKYIQDRVLRRWVDYAYSLGDETYLEATKGNPLYPPYRTYHDVGL